MLSNMFHYRPSSKTIILSSFSVVIILMALIISTSLTEFTDANQRLNRLVNINSVKQQLVDQMHISAFKRVSSLQRMLLLADHFERDDEALLIDEEGTVFANARNRLLAMPLSESEQQLLLRQSQYAKITVPLIREVVQLIRQDQTDPALTILQNEIIPAQQEIFAALNKLRSIQDSTVKEAFNQTIENQQLSKYNILIMGLVAAALSCYIAYLTFMRVRRAERKLSQEKERAEITLHSIADGVITTDERGLIQYINPVAEALTGWPASQAINRSLLNVFHVINNTDNSVFSNIGQLINHENSELSLITKNNEKLPIEQNTTVLPSQSIKDNGVVVIFRNVTETRKLTQSLNHQATHDPLTDLYNRLAFEKALPNYIKRAQHKNNSHILCFMDLDYFKQVNDSAGHVAGDELLIQLTRIFSKHIRNTDFLARMGGDEFALILENCDQEKAFDITESIRDEVDNYVFNWMGKQYHVSVSIGITVIDKQSDDITRLLEQADQACYLAKESGRNLIKIFTANDHESEQNPA